ncbi:hypothetical protein A3844_12105 [Paenibacillus helianthi]|uniref:Uncharacterized protein n=1 Tax=Paenibacillus helianthi TaxID=1349432 RepID=A0ABX3ENH4_9BACL|nr:MULTISPECIES: hypothetical protein [Paenibacillus]OKP75414.1 hypothetical protein A3842_20045 [Paenibacillus sp. P3E]OKP84428.1 hypothetical protein A3848_24445 [Paenibacillus sp. P32E]OKP86743.1 hypothetical protein A3844_12105 [Paenibacillus helianthi]
MNTSSFLTGVLMGAAISMIMSKKRGAMISSLLQPNGQMNGAGEKAKDKIMGMAMTGFGSTASGNATAGNTATGNTNAGSHTDNTTHVSHSNNEHKGESAVKSKEANLKMLKDFIRSNPEVKHEVEQILKDTHSSIPGL